MARGGKIRKALIGIVFVFAMPGAVWAGDNSFEKTDKNKTGRLDMKTLDDKAMSLFKAYDKNGDGYIDKSEFMQIKGAKTSFRNLDKSNDGRIDIEELREAALRKFKACDTNGDGYLDEEELEACMAQTPDEESPAAAEERDRRVRMFDRSQRWSLETESRAAYDNSRLPSDSRKKPVVAPVFSVYF